jgi:single-stranded DNA-binding protein
MPPPTVAKEALNNCLLLGTVAEPLAPFNTNSGVFGFRLTLEVGRENDTRTDKIPVNCYGNLAELLFSRLQQGDSLLAECSLRTYSTTESGVPLIGLLLRKVLPVSTS